jgi:alpha-L-fucosidase
VTIIGMRPTRSIRLLLPIAIAAIGCFEKTGPVLGPPSNLPVPAAVAPVPSPAQLDWQRQEIAAFLHFGMNTFTNKEQGDGTESPALFNPTAFDARQWITALRSAGVRQAMLTAKHHDGFCLWPTACTTYSVAASPFAGGRGDVVRQFVDAAREGNVRVALALSPLDRHDPSYGTPAYRSVFDCQLTELLTNYGAVDEIWLWQAPGAPLFDWETVRDLVRNIQSQTLVEFANLAPNAVSDVRSVGHAAPGNPQPPPTDQSSVQSPGGAGGATAYIPAEAVYSIRPGWFWHAAEDAEVKSVSELVDLYFDSVGRNSLLRLNVPPDTRGRLADPDVAALNQLGPAIAALYRTNVAAGQAAIADSVFEDLAPYAAASAVDGKLETFWAARAGETRARLEVDLGGNRSFDLISLQEPIALGERATRHHVEARENGVWTVIASGTAIGARKLHRASPVVADRVALVITEARGAPAISELGVYDTTNAAAAAASR